jgi:hypothetical protein
MRRPRTSLPTKSALHRFRVALWVGGVLAIAVGCARLYAGEFAHMSLVGMVPSSFLILFGLFFIGIAVLWRPKTLS